jgi:hypothetical protein
MKCRKKKEFVNEMRWLVIAIQYKNVKRWRQLAKLDPEITRMSRKEIETTFELLLD